MGIPSNIADILAKLDEADQGECKRDVVVQMDPSTWWYHTALARVHVWPLRLSLSSLTSSFFPCS